jgi:hypothetical protein
MNLTFPKEEKMTASTSSGSGGGRSNLAAGASILEGVGDILEATTKGCAPLAGCLTPIVTPIVLVLVLMCILMCACSGLASSGIGFFQNPVGSIGRNVPILGPALFPTPEPGIFGIPGAPKVGIPPTYFGESCVWNCPTPTPTPQPTARPFEGIPLIGPALAGPSPTPMPTNTPGSKPTATPKPTVSPTPMPQRLGELKTGSPKLAIEIGSCTFPFSCGGNGSLTVTSLEIYQGKIALVADVTFKGIGENYLWTEGGTLGPTVLKVNGSELPAEIGQANINLPANAQLAGVKIWFVGSLDPRTLGNGTQVSIQAPWLKNGRGTIK